jgi:hypothetical protein
MATVQTSKSPSTGKSRNVETDTGERDENYNLISTLYHALQGAESCALYVQDAERTGDEQLAQFFEEARGGHIELAQQAKQLLAARLAAEIDDDDLIAE